MMWLDGEPVPQAGLDALALVNYGHFTTMRVDHGRVRGLRLHLARLVRDCRTLFDAELDPTTVRDLARQAAALASTPEVVMRITVFDPELGLHQPAAPARPRVLVTLRPVPTDGAAPVRLRTVRYARQLPEVKHTGLLGAVHQRRAAQLDGYDDALFVDAEDRITEGPTWNIAFLDSGRVIWPAGDHLPGVTTRLLDAALDKVGLTGRTAAVSRADVSPAEVTCGGPTGRYAAVITNSAIGVRTVAAIDGVPLPAAPALVEALRQAYQAVEPEPL